MFGKTAVCKIAGVTFDNDDGSNRQKLLESLAKESPVIVKLQKTKYHNPETNQDEDAIQIWRNGLLLGWIPRTHISSLWNTDEMICYCNKYKETWSGALYYKEKPTPKQYQTMKCFKLSGKIANWPDYEKHVYADIIEKIRLNSKAKSYA